MTVAEKYQFTLEFPSGGFSEAYPVNDTLIWQWRKADGKRYFRRDLTTELTFHNDAAENIVDFNPWYIMARNKQICEKILLTIDAKCDEAFQEHWRGQTTLLDAKFDASLCTVDTKFQPNDPYACIYNNWEKEKNVLFGTEPQTLRVIQGTYQFSQICMEEVVGLATETFRFSQTIVTNCINQNEGWTLWKQFYSWVSANDPNNPDLGTWSLQTQWIREFLDVAVDPGGEWLPVSSGGYARPVPVTIDFEQIGTGIIQKQYRVIFPGDIGIDNGRLLNEVIQLFWDEYCSADYPLVSNFFGISPDGTQPDNTAYTAALSKLQELVIFAKGDIIRHDADENNTILNMTFKGLMEDLEKMFNVELRFRDDKFYLEHYSYFIPDLFLDLTADKYIDCITDKWAWSYMKEQVPPREVFQWEDYTDYGPALDLDFDGLPIWYGEDCTTEQTERVIRVEKVTTNIEKLIEDGDPENFTLVAGQSYVMVASSGGFILREAGAISGDIQLNGALAWANIHRDYYKWGRPLNRGVMNGQRTEFFSSKKIRKQVAIDIPMCCSELEDFDPDRIIIKTQLGHGEVESATYNDPPGVLTLELVFD